MYELIPLPLSAGTLAEYGGAAGLRRELADLGCQGTEAIWAGEPVPAEFPRELAVGWHLTFFTDWLDLYREDRSMLLEKYGSMEEARRFYGGLGADYLLEVYRADLARAKAMGVKYIVFHVSDVSIEEGYTYRWLHSNEEVIDSAAEAVNTLLDGRDWPFDFLMENQWWPGFTFLEPKETARLLERVHYHRRGILLDTGHLMNANTKLRTQAEGAAYIRTMVEKHGSLAGEIRGIHLHQSLSGDYVRSNTGFLPHDLPEDYTARYCVSYRHIQRIDRHLPWSDPSIIPVLAQIKLKYVTHELSCGSRQQRWDAVCQQRNLLLHGGF